MRDLFWQQSFCKVDPMTACVIAMGRSPSDIERRLPPADTPLATADDLVLVDEVVTVEAVHVTRVGDKDVGVHRVKVTGAVGLLRLAPFAGMAPTAGMVRGST